MNLLFTNDRAGAYPPSWYAGTAPSLPLQPPLQGRVQADVCVIGAGYTGLSAALHLAQMGARVVVLEAQRIGFGASGRNGGQVGSGQRVDQMALERWLGQDHAQQLWGLGEDAKALVQTLLAQHQINADWTPGILSAARRPAERDWLNRYADHVARVYGYEAITALAPDQFQALLPSPAYCGGALDQGAGHVHPLKYALGLARAALDQGTVIHENSLVLTAKPGLVRTQTGHIEAPQILLACNGYLGGLNRHTTARVMPINNFIAATAPLDDPSKTLNTKAAVADQDFVVNYFRLSPDNRLLFGGGESYSTRFPADLDRTIRKPLARIFPHLADVPFTHTWGGTLAVTRSRMPFLAQPQPGLWTATGYSGHGVSMATLAGKLVAQAIQGQNSGFETVSKLPSLRFPGGASLRSPLLKLGMAWYALRDRIG
jgi:gamma-glutamylputrescine oxidase